MYTITELRHLAVRAATISERFDNSFEEILPNKADARLGAARLAAWCEHACSGDWTQFGRLLHSEDVSFEFALNRLSNIRLRDEAPLLRWTSDAQWVSAAMAAPLPETFKDHPERGVKYAFQDLFSNLARRAEEIRNSAVADSALQCFEASALADVRGYLVARLSALFSDALYHSFSVQRGEFPRNVDDIASSSSYSDFISHMRTGGLRRLFDEYPVLLRLSAVLVRQWIETTGEFISRFSADHTEIHQVFCPTSEVLRVGSVSLGWSDPHNAGHVVAILQLSNGSSVVYKPKSLGVDAHWHNIIEWLNNEKAPIDLRAPRVIDRNSYGWSEYISYADVSNEASASRFFSRGGALLALSYLLAGADMHEENVIASGEYPVLIDVEMLLQSFAEEQSFSPSVQAGEIAHRRVSRSVLSTGLLPGWLVNPETSAITTGGLVERDLDRERCIVWDHINTDWMRPGIALPDISEVTNLPKMKGRPVNLFDFKHELLAALDEYLKFILSIRPKLLRSAALSNFSEVIVRRLYKNTRFYSLLIARLSNFRSMNDGVFWSAQADFVWRFADWNVEKTESVVRVRSERDALTALNVPLFLTDHSSETGIKRRSMTSGFAEAMSRIEQLSVEEISWQVEAAAMSLFGGSSSARHPMTPRQFSRFRPGEQYETKSAAHGICKIAQALQEACIRKGPSASWIGVRPLAGTFGIQRSVLGPDLYSGAGGIALFLAAHGLVFGCTTSSDLAYAAIAHSRYCVVGPRATHLTRIGGVGGLTGLGSTIYVLSTLSNLLQDQQLLDEALWAARLLTDDIIVSDQVFDIVGGVAGCILSLLKLYRDTKASLVIDKAITCGAHLLRQRSRRPPYMWPNLNGISLSGMSHGAAGFGLALAALAEASGKNEFKDAALECLVYEDSIYSERAANWRDLRVEDGASAFPVQWCHGAGGIGISRIGMARAGITSDRIGTDVEKAAEAVSVAGPLQLDTLCCGNSGSVEFLTEASTFLSDRKLRGTRDQILSNLISRVDALDLKKSNEQWAPLGFFTGLSGIGYTLLRQTESSTLPNVLLWE